MAIPRRILAALENESFHFAYEPIVDRDGKETGKEILLRVDRDGGAL